MPVPNIFGTATSAIPLSQLDTNFATPVTIGNTAVQLGNTVTSFGNVTLTNVTISSGNVTIAGANVSGTANVSTLVVTGNQSFVGTGNRITGDFTNATVANRVAFQTSTKKTSTIVSAFPSGTGTASRYEMYSNSDGTNASTFQLTMFGAADARLLSGITGTGTYLPMTFYTGGSESLRISATTKAVILAGGSTSANGTGITFPATQSASSDANTLDDYEEGTWTPAFAFGGGTTGMTYSVQSGKYTKVGNSVTCTGRIVFSNKGSSTGNATITGLPFTTGSGDASFSAVSLLPDAVTYTGFMSAISTLSSTSISVYSITEAGTPTQLTNSNYSNSSQTIITITYLI